MSEIYAKEREREGSHTDHILRHGHNKNPVRCQKKKEKTKAMKSTCLGCCVEVICGGGGGAKTREAGCPGP